MTNLQFCVFGAIGFTIAVYLHGILQSLQQIILLMVAEKVEKVRKVDKPIIPNKPV